jgi:hypothetical protein
VLPPGSAAAAAPRAIMPGGTATAVSVALAAAAPPASAPASTGAAPAAAAGFLQELSAAPDSALSAAEGASGAVHVQNPGKVRVKKAKVAVVQSVE